MRKKCCVVLWAAAAVALLTGCQQIPDKPVVTEKNQEQMLNAAENGGENSSPLSAYEIPGRFTGDWASADGRTAVHADAEIQLPTVQAIPTGTVSRRDFTQEDADRLLSVFIGDNTFYQEQGFTKQDAKRVIEMYREILRGERPVSDAGEFAKIEDIPGNMEEMTEMLETLPDESERFPASRTFEPNDFYDEVIEGYAEVDGRTTYIYIYNFQGSADQAVCYADGYADRGGTNGSYAVPCIWLDTVPQESISETEARAAGEELIASLGFTDVVCDKSTQVAFIKNGSDSPGMVPGETNNVMHLDNITSGKSQTVSLDFRTTRDVPAGNQSFFVKLDYEDLYGGIYSEARSFLVQVTQPAEMKYDPVTVPAQVISGETFLLPVNVCNTGKSTLRNVAATISAPGLFPMASVFLSDILPGQSGSGEMKVYAGRLSMTEGYTQDYGKSDGVFTVTYTDDTGEIQEEETEFSTEIVRFVAETEEGSEEPQTVGQWWISILAAFSIISILVAVIVTTNFTRMMRMRMRA